MRFAHQSSTKSPFVSGERTSYHQTTGFRLVGLASRGLYDEGVIRSSRAGIWLRRAPDGDAFEHGAMPRGSVR
jgi:hypothetical protein